MKQILVFGILAGAGVLAWLLGSRLSADALGMAVGLLFGLLAAVPTLLLVLASSRRRPSREDDGGQGDAPVYIIYNTHHDNRSITVQAPQGMPLLADRQREIQQQEGRVFRVVGEREEWQPEHNGWLPIGHSGMKD